MEAGTRSHACSSDQDRRPRRTIKAGFALLFAAVGALLLVVFGALWKPLLVALVLASVTLRWQDELARRLGCRATLSSALLTAGLVLIVLVPVAYLAYVAISEAIGAIDFVQHALGAGGLASLIARLPEPIQDWAGHLRSMVAGQAQSLLARVASSGWVAARALGGAASRTFALLLDLAMMLVAYFLLVRDGHALARWTERWSPISPAQTRALFEGFQAAARSIVGSIIVSAGAQGALAAIGFWITGVPQPIFFGMLTFLAAFIPSVGTGIVGLPLALVLLISGQIWQGLVLLSWMLGLVATIDNLIKPLLMRGQTPLPAGVIFFSLIGGILVFGAAGVIVGPLASALFVELLHLARRDLGYPNGRSSRAPDLTLPGGTATGRH